MSLMALGRGLLLLSFAVVAATLNWVDAARAAEGEKRLALVIGNSAYKHITPLINPTNDAKDIAAKLKALKFEVLLATDASQETLASLLREFRSQADAATHRALLLCRPRGDPEQGKLLAAGRRAG